MHAGAGVRVKVGGLTCYYRISTTDDGQRAEWELREGDQACFKSTFSRVVSSASSARCPTGTEQSRFHDRGEWTPSNSDKTMEILQNDSGALSLKRSGYALANLSWATQSGSNAHLQSEGLNCYYIVTFDNTFETMRWRMRSGTAKCPDGLFSKTPSLSARHRKVQGQRKSLRGGRIVSGTCLSPLRYSRKIWGKLRGCD